MEKRKLKPKEIVADIRAGVDDSTLMHRYALSAQGLQSVFSKLVKAGMITQAELDDRVPMAERTVDIGLYICPACGNIQGREFTECPRCGFTPPGFLKKPKDSEPPKEEPAKATLASKSQVINLKEAKKPVAAARPKPAPVEAQPTGVAFGQLNRIAGYCQTVGIVALVVYVLSVAAMFALAQLGLPASTMNMTQWLLTAGILGLPVLVSALLAFFAFKAVSESIRILMRITGSRLE